MFSQLVLAERGKLSEVALEVPGGVDWALDGGWGDPMLRVRRLTGGGLLNFREKDSGSRVDEGRDGPNKGWAPPSIGDDCVVSVADLRDRCVGTEPAGRPDVTTEGDTSGTRTPTRV